METKNKIGRIPISYAARIGYFECFKIFHESKADINQVDDFGDSCLHYACLHAHHEILEYILSKNYNINLHVIS